jgi:hypothetical protein
VVKDKPAEAVDSCVQSGQFVSQSLCDNIRTSDILPINVAGAPAASNILKCQLKPLSKADYPNTTFTDAQWSDLQAAFPSGVCDWTRPGVGQQAPIGSWLDFSRSVGGEVMGPAPVSIPFGPAASILGPGTGGTPNTSASRPAVPAALVALLGGVVGLALLLARTGPRRSQR